MTEYGVLDTGFCVKPLDVLIAEAAALSITLFGTNIDTTDSSPLGKVFQNNSAEMSILWENLNTVYLAPHLDDASGVNLDAITELLGVNRKRAVRSTGYAMFSGVPGTTVPGSTVIKTTGDTPIEFKTDTSIVLADLITNGEFTTDTSDWTAENAATLNSVASGKDGNCLQITRNGFDDPFAGQIIAVTENLFYDFSVFVKAGTAATYNVDIYDETNAEYIYESGNLTETACDWSTEVSQHIEIPAGCSSVSVRLVHRATTGSTTMLFDSCELIRVAPITAIDTGTDSNVAAETILSLSSPVSDITAVINNAATSGGLEKETDVALRIRTKQSIGAGGKATLNAIVAAVLAVDNVSSATIEENDTAVDNIGTGGLPPHSVRVSVQGGSDNGVAQAILDSVAGGIRAYGTDHGEGELDNGQLFDRYFMRPAEVLIYVDAAITSDDTYAGADAVETAIIDYIGGKDADSVIHAGLGAGDNVLFYEIISAIMDVTGVTNVVLGISTTVPPPAPTGTSDISISATEAAYATTTSIEIT